MAPVATNLKAGPQSETLGFRRTVVIILAACAWRVISALIAALSNLVFSLAPTGQATMFGRPSVFWDPFMRYDGGWYYQIAAYGYRFVEGGPPVGLGKAGKIAFFPLYPVLMRYAGRLFGTAATDVYFGGILVSWAAFALAMVMVVRLAQLDMPRRDAEFAALLMAIFPFSFFFGMIYTEALFLLLTVSSFYAFRTRHWLLGGVLGGLAAATRVNGILMIPALAWIAWRQARPGTRDRLQAFVGLALVAAGVAAYSAYVYWLTGHPFEWFTSIEQWSYFPGGNPWLASVRLIQSLSTRPYAYLTTDRTAPYDTLYGVTGILFVAAIPFVWYRFGVAYGLLMAANLYLPLSSGTFEGMGRYCSVLFPCFFWLATRQSRVVRTGLIVLFALLYPVGLSLFATMRPLF